MVQTLLFLALCAAPAGDAGAPERATAFAPGEQLTFKVTVLGVEGAGLHLQVDPASVVEGVSAWPVVAQLNSKGALDRVFPVHDHYVAWWDPLTEHAVATRLSASEGGNRYGYVMRYRRQQPAPDGGIVVNVDHRDGTSVEKLVRSLDPEVEDFLAALYWLRTRPLRAGEEDSVPIFMGQVQWKLVARVVGVETVELDTRKESCVHVRMSAQFSGPMGNKRDLDVYFSDDASHTPVLMDSELLLGHFRAELVDVRIFKDPPPPKSVEQLVP